MRSALDAARRSLTDVAPPTAPALRERLAHKIATECTPAEIATLVNEIIMRQRDLHRELAELEARVYVVMRASGMRHLIDAKRKA
jgi:hypothetical protein